MEQAEVAAFLREHSFYLKERQIDYSEYDIWQTFSWKWRSEPVTSRKTADSIYCQREHLSFQAKNRILENLVYHSKLDYLAVLRLFISSDINKYNVSI